MAQATQTPTPAAPPPAATPRKQRRAGIEARIAALHASLKITPAQEEKWKAVAQVMRDNARDMGEIIRNRRQHSTTMNALDDMRSYAAIADAHAAGVHKLIPVFEALYASMTPDQKRNADIVFRHRGRRPRPKPAAQ